jgi:multisubunit Na+/H+ antiporter MnhF subunit
MISPLNILLATVATSGGPDAAETVLWSTQLVSWIVTVSIVLISLGMVACIYRLLRGPHLLDRALAVETLAVQLIGLVLLLMIHWQTAWFIDGVMVLSLLGFAGTVAVAQFVGRLRQRGHDATDHAPAAAPSTGNEP